MKRRGFLKITTAGSIPFILPKTVINSFDLTLPTDELKSRFINPPYTARPQGFWFWMNGNITKDGITRDIQEMDAVGFGGVLNMNVTDGIPAGAVDYDSPEWHEMMKHSLQTLKKHNMQMVSYNCAGWSSGGGPWISPDQSMKQLVWSERQIQGGNKKFQDKLPEGKSRYNYYRDIAVLAFPTPAIEISTTIRALGLYGNPNFRLMDWKAKAGLEHIRTTNLQPDTRHAGEDEVIDYNRIIDISDKMSDDGMLSWEVPEGNWTVMRFGFTTTGGKPAQAPQGGLGLECDKLSKESTIYHWNQMVSRIMKDAGPLTGDTLFSIEIDSFEAGTQNWTQNFIDEFEKRRGYKILHYLPCVTGRVIESTDKSERFLWDFRRTIADLFTENYYGTFAGLCHKNGMKFSIEPYGPTGIMDCFSVAARADIPMGELWVNRYDAYHASSSKIASSAAHANGLNVVGAESFTAAFPNSGWDSDPYSLKNLGDFIMTQGVNRLIFHNTVHHPWHDFTPGMTMGPHGIQMNRGNTWYKQSAAWLSHLSRSSFLLQQGQFIGDICYYFGEDVPNNLKIREEIKPLPPKGYDYDALATEFIMQFKVENGQLVLPGGMKYRILVLSDSIKAIHPEIVQKIHDLVQSGATVIAPKPESSPGLTNYPNYDVEVQTLADKLWGNIDGKNVTDNNLGKGHIYWGKPVEEVLKELNVPPDFYYTGKDDPELEYIHRRIEGEDVYFVSNQTQRYAHVECTFRSIGNPERWEPETGTVEDIVMYKEDKGRTVMPMLMAPAESLFIIFKNGKKRNNWVVDARLNNRNILEANVSDIKELKMLEARLGIVDDTSNTIDVMEEVSSRIYQGQLDIIPCRHIRSDPGPLVSDSSKQLFIKYQLNGKVESKTISWGTRIVIPAQPAGLTLPTATLHSVSNGTISLHAWKGGSFHIRMADGKSKTISLDNVPVARAIKGSWIVKFPSGWGAPPQVSFDDLISWTEHSHNDIKHFSGTATYEKDLNIPEESIGKDRLLYLDLGKVKNIAEVLLNGKNMGIFWKPPFRINISDAVKAGNNQLQIKLTNLLPNRLIGDAGKPDIRSFIKKGNSGYAPDKWDEWLKIINDEQETKRYKKETGRYTFATWKRFDKDDPLLESGLIGPVRLLTAIKHKIKH